MCVINLNSWMIQYALGCQVFQNLEINQVVDGENEMTSDELMQFGEALYGGNRVASNLSHALEVNVRTIRRWMSGDLKIPAEVEDQLKQLLWAKREILLNLLK